MGLLALALGCWIGGLAWAHSAGAQELLSWWKRDLIQVDLTPGSWVRYASTERSEGELYTDSLKVAVVDVDSLGRRWVTLSEEGATESELLLIDPADLRPDRSLLDALDRRLRILASGEVLEESVDELRDSRILQRHFQDMFVRPTVTRTSLSDSLLSGQPCSRERILLEERREEDAPVGSSTLITSIRSEAVVSPCVPIFSVLAARTVTEVTSKPKSPHSLRRKLRPLRTVLEWHCIGFGRNGPTGLPPGVEP